MKFKLGVTMIGIGVIGLFCVGLMGLSCQEPDGYFVSGCISLTGHPLIAAFAIFGALILGAFVLLAEI